MTKQAHQPLPAVLACLAEEHRHMSALTRLLEVRASQEPELTHGDYCLLRDVVGYLHDYPDQVHHPTEDLLFKRLGKLKPELQKEIRVLHEQHRELADQSQALLAELDQAADGVRPGSSHGLRARIKRYAAFQSRHMQRENRQLFPAALAELGPADWRVISRRVKLHEDPLFGPRVQGRHRTLFEFLLDAEQEFVGNIAAGGVGAQERLILSVAELERGSRESLQILGRAAGQLLDETRSLLGGEQTPKSLGDLLRTPWRYGGFMVRTAGHCGSVLLGIAARTTRQAFGAALRPPR